MRARRLKEELLLYLDFIELAELLKEDSILTYKMQHQLFHSPMGKKIKVWHKNGAAMMFDHSLHMYGQESILDEFLSQLEGGKVHHFFGVPAKLLGLLERHFDSIQREEDCTAYTLTQEDLSANIVSRDSLDSLTLGDAEFVNEHWTYKHEGSLDFFQRLLRTYPSSAIRIDGQLAGWAVCYDAIDEMTNLGSLKVLEEYRNQGLGKKLSIDLVQKVLKLGKTPMVHILDNNTASKNLSIGIGFRPHTEKIFWGSGIKK